MLPPTPVPSSPAQAVKPAPANGREVMLNQLLTKARVALSANRLTKPEVDNAYDLFRAVMLLDADNAEATAGLDAVLISLVSAARDELARGRMAQAETLAVAAAERFGGNPLLTELRSDIRAARAQQEAAVARARQNLAEDKSQKLIPVAFLGAETASAKAWFAELGQQIQADDASIMIYARSDAEGRKIYRLLKAGVTDYLLRGDIRIGNPPRVQLLEPLP